MKPLSADARARLTRFAQALVDQGNARVVVPPEEPREGSWFGGGNAVAGPKGEWYLVGRYRSPGDSRAGLAQGTRGRELAVFRSTDQGASFHKILSFDKAALAVGRCAVLSIEGAKLHFGPGGVELFLSTEKEGIGYPPGLEAYRKPGTGVWTIDRIGAPAVEALAGGSPRILLEGTDPRWLHLKDPVVFDAASGDTVLFFCTHPYSWSSSNSAVAVRARGAESFSRPNFEFLPRGFTWDVAITRVTGLCRVPSVPGIPRGTRLLFYDGGESLRKNPEHPTAVSRPRGYSCEELGGIAAMVEPWYDRVQRLSVELPAFVSPHGTGCSRYVSVLETQEGFFTTWQQSQPDLSQPLVGHFLQRAEAERVLNG